MFNTTNTTKQTIPKLPFEAMADDILGKRYDVSLVFIGADRAQKLNLTHRQKTYTPNVLSFPLTDTAGEIFICPRKAQKEARKWALSPQGYIGFLYIHALLHLKGMAHGDTMEAAEAKYVSKYKLK